MGKARDTSAIEMDFARIGALLEEVRQAGGSIPDRYGLGSCAPSAEHRQARGDLACSIQSAFDARHLHRELSSDAPAKARHRDLKSLRVQARRMRAILDRNDSLRSEVAARMKIGELGLVEEGLRRFEAAAAATQTTMRDGALMPGRADGSTEQTTLYRMLARAYQRGLDADPDEGLTRGWNTPGGPYAVFIRFAHRIAGQPEPTDAALAKALERAPSLRDGAAEPTGATDTPGEDHDPAAYLRRIDGAAKANDNA